MIGKDEQFTETLARRQTRRDAEMAALRDKVARYALKQLTEPPKLTPHYVMPQRKGK